MRALFSANRKFTVAGQVFAEIINRAVVRLRNTRRIQNLLDDNAGTVVFHEHSAGTALEQCLPPFALIKSGVVNFTAAQFAFEHFAFARLPVASGLDDRFSVSDQAGDHLHQSVPGSRFEFPCVANGICIPASAQLHDDFIRASLQKRCDVVFLIIHALVIGGKGRRQQSVRHGLTVDSGVKKTHAADLKRRFPGNLLKLKYLAELRRCFEFPERRMVVRTENPFCVLNHSFVPPFHSLLRQQHF